QNPPAESVEMNQEARDEQSQAANHGHGALPDNKPLSGRTAVFVIVILLIVAVVVVIAGIVPRVRARAQLKDQTDALAPPNVITKPPQKGQVSREIVLPGNSYAYTDAPLYARTDG